MQWTTNTRLAAMIPAYVYSISIIVTEFWKITHIVAPETIGIFDFTMVLLIAENPSQMFLEIFL